ncbi:CDP-glycerol glycerophosphotransferase family protein [Massilistercora timonensis]|uniref:CDP-glycerol glycerophosphotransferase family protein n=1 Tax=Massilistercora timonensis TaxID=2086584 RepID=UPI0032097681
MKSVVVFDTAIGTSNLGDEIILQCLEEELSFLLDDSFVMRFGTHIKNLGKDKYIWGSQKLQFAYEADYKLVMGTNLLSRDIKATQAQWPIGKLDSWIYDNCIMAGVGTTLSEGNTTRYSKKIYKRILRQDFYHSVRDEDSKRLLEDMGFKAINTGCPTLWKLTPDFCKQIPTQKADRVIFSLSGYKAQQDRAADRKLIYILKRNYKELFFWCQTSRDELYLDTFEGVEDIPRIYSLKKYEQILNEGGIDYVGTRLHGGVYAMQHKVRSIVISIDHRARGFHDTNNLCICEREEIPEKLEEMINGEIVTDIRLRQDDIDRWKAQFYNEYEKTERKTHEDILWIKILRLPKRIKRKLKKIYRLFRNNLKKIRKSIRRKVKKVRSVLFRIYIKYIYSKTIKKLPVEKGKIMFFTFQGDYTCNPKYISEEIFRRNLNWQQVWVTMGDQQDEDSFPANVKIVKFNTKEYYNELARSQIWIDNAFNFPKGFVVKKEGQTYIQTMHGSLGLKRIGPEVVNDAKRNARGFRCGELTDICISNSSFETMVYRTSFWEKCNIQELGHARNDIFFKESGINQKIRNKVCEYFGINTDIKMALYAPTFRSGQELVDFEGIDFEKLEDALKKRFGGQWIILNRAHHSRLKRLAISELPFVKNANNYPDIQELMIAVDVGITDYSSWICDYVLTYKPGFLYTPDLDIYDVNRGFYYPLEETPFPICNTNDELEAQILSFDLEKFRQKTDTFLQARGCIDDGHASEHIVDMLIDLVENS